MTYVHGVSPHERMKHERAHEIESGRQDALKGMPTRDHGESHEDYHKRVHKHVSQYHPDVRHALAHSYSAPHFEGDDHAKKMVETIRSTLETQHSEETEQFAENPKADHKKIHKLLEIHGYSTKDNGGTYEHKDGKHSVALSGHWVGGKHVGAAWTHYGKHTSPYTQTKGVGVDTIKAHLEKTHSASQHSEDDDDDDGSPGNVQLSRHHKHLKSKGFRYVASGNNGWTAHYEHPDTGRKAHISWHHSADEHGTLHGVKPAASSQHSEEETTVEPGHVTPERARELVAQTPGGHIVRRY